MIKIKNDTPRIHFKQLKVVKTLVHKTTGETRKVHTQGTFDWSCPVCLFQESNQGWLIHQFDHMPMWKLTHVKPLRWFNDSCELPKGHSAWQLVNS